MITATKSPASRSRRHRGAERSRLPAGTRVAESTAATSALRAHPQVGLLPAASASERRALLADIARRGLLVPVEITKDKLVLDGHQRLQIARELALKKIPVRVVAPVDEVEYMLRAALTRRQLSAGQRATLALELANYEQLRDAARGRQRANLRQHAEVATLPARGRTRDLIAKTAAVSARIAQDVITVYEHDKALYERVRQGELAAANAAQQARRAQRDQQLPDAPPLPAGPFELIYADPPWAMGNPDGAWAPEQHYPTLSLAEIKALAVPPAEQAILFLWAVNSLLPEALEVIDAWGFEYLTNLVWVKPSIGLGRWLRSRHELLLLARRGGHPAPDPRTLADSVLTARRGRHSEKPAAVYQLIERMYPTASKLELFARGTARPGWTAWGNEASQ